MRINPQMQPLYEICNRIQSHFGTVGISLGTGCLLAGIISWIFYDSIAAIWLILFTVPGIWILRVRHKKKKKDENIQKQFLDLISFLSVSLRAGYSVEQGFQEAGIELERLYHRDTAVMNTIRELKLQMNLNRPLEAVFSDSCLCRECREARRFAEVLEYAKRSGGDLVGIMERTALQIRENISIMREIETQIAGKKMEQKIMLQIPLLLLLFIKVTSPEFLAPLYHNLFGVGFMSCALAGYLAAVIIGMQIMEIRI